MNDFPTESADSSSPARTEGERGHGVRWSGGLRRPRISMDGSQRPSAIVAVGVLPREGRSEAAAKRATPSKLAVCHLRGLVSEVHPKTQGGDPCLTLPSTTRSS